MLLDGLYELLNRRYPSLSVLLCLLSQQRDNKFPSPYTHHTPPITPHTLPPPQLYNTHNRCPSSLIAPALSVASKLLARRGRIGSNPGKFRQDFKNWNNFECIWYFPCFTQFVCSYSWKVMVSPFSDPSNASDGRWKGELGKWQIGGRGSLFWVDAHYIIVILHMVRE